MTRVAALWRYPVKSFQGEPVEHVDLRPGGVVGDRQYAVRDVATGKILTAKRVGTLLYGTARHEGEDVVLALPDGTEVAANDPSVHRQLSSWLERDVVLVHAVDAAPDGTTAVGTNGVYEFNFIVDGEPQVEEYDIPIPAGSFVDLCDAHLLTSASIAAAQAYLPDGDWNVRRLRPTVLLDGAGEGFVEDDWVGGEVRLGAATVAIELLTMRCVMPTRPQPAVPGSPVLLQDKRVARVISDERSGNLGVYARVTTPGIASVGDDVTFTPAPAPA